MDRRLTNGVFIREDGCKGGRFPGCRVGLVRMRSGDRWRERKNLIPAHLPVDVLPPLGRKDRRLECWKKKMRKTKAGEMKAEMLKRVTVID